MNYRTLIQKCCSIMLTLVMVFNPTFVSAQTASEYLAKAGEGLTNGFSSAGENLSLAGSALARDIRDSVIATAESIKTETVNLAVNTKDAIVAEAQSVKQSVLTYATDTRDGAVELKNISREAGHSLIRRLTRTGDSILSYFSSISTLAAATPQANQQISWLGPQRTHDTPTAFESATEAGIALLQENTLLDSVVGSFSTQLAAAALALPHFSLTTDIFSTSRNPVFHAFTHATARPVFASNNQPLPEPQPDTPAPARTLAQAPAKKLAQASAKADASVGSPTSSSVGAVILTQSTPSATPQVITSLGTVFEDILALRLQQLENKLASRISALSASTNAQATQTYQVIAQTNKIDQLSGTAISSATITGSSFSGSSVSATNLSAGNATSTNLFATTASSTNLFSQTASFGSTSISSSLTVNGTFSVSGAFSQSDLATFTSGFLSNSSSTITSGLFSMNGGASTTNITASGIGYFTTATTTNLFSTNFNLGTGTLGSSTSTNSYSSSLTAGNASITSLISTGATTTNLFSTTASSTNLFSQLATLGTLTLGNALAISNGGTATTTQVTNGVNYFDGTRITSGTALTYDGTKLTAPYASSTALSVSGIGYFGSTQISSSLTVNGTASTTNLTVSSLTASRVPYITTAGAFTDSANLTFDGTTLTAANFTSGGNVSLGNATTTNLFSTTASSTNLFSQAASVGTLAAGGAATLSSTLGVTGLTTLGNLSLTAGTTTNFFSTTASSTNLFSQTASLGTLTLGNALAVTSGGTGVTTSTGTGSVVLSASPTLTGTIAGASQTLSGTLGVSGLSTLAGFLSNASSTITSGLFSMNGGASTTNITASGTGYFGLGQFTNTSGTTTIASGQGFTVGSSQLVVQQGSGNVGIGTTNPVAMLEVVGHPGIYQSRYGAGPIMVQRMAGGTISIPTKATALATIGLYGAAGYQETTSAFSSYVGSIRFNASEDFTSTAQGTYATIWTTPNGSTVSAERMRIDNAGNVGIGTTGPTAKLDVLNGTANTAGESITSNTARIVGPNVAVGTVADNSGILNVVTNDALGADIGGSIGFGGRYTGTAEAHWAIIKGGKENATDGQYGGYLTFAVRANGAPTYEAMRIQPNGNVGIGTTSPVAALHVATTFTSGSTDAYGIYLNSTVIPGAASKNVYGMYLAPVLAEQSSGTQPLMSALNIEPTFQNNAGSVTTLANAINVATFAAAAGTVTATGISVAAPTAATNNYAAIFTGGNVGIGTTGPGSLLHLSKADGTAIITLDRNDADEAINSPDSYGQIQWKGNDANTDAGGVRASIDVISAGSTGQADMYFRTSGSGSASNQTNMFIAAGGNVGIGTTSPAKLLTVGSGSAAANVLINSSASPSLLIQVNSTNKWEVGVNTQFGTDGFFIYHHAGTPEYALGITTAGNVTPGVDNTQTLGSSSLHWDCVYYDATSLGTCASDSRLKGNIADLSLGNDALAQVVGLRPRTFTFNDNPAQTVNYGFIAQEVQAVAPEMVTTSENGYLAVRYGYLPYLTIKAIQELNLNVEGIASTTATSTPSAQSFAERFFSNIFARITAWLADATNGIGKFFAKEVHTDKLCVSDSSGEVCVTKTQLESLIAGAAASTGGASSSSTESSASTGGDTPQGGVTSGSVPTISINGNNPATITVGDTFGDLGAIITGPTTADTNLGIYTFLDGVAMDTINLDTSIAGTHTIDYVATNSAGTATSTRTVIVSAQGGSASGGQTEDNAVEPQINAEETPAASAEDGGDTSSGGVTSDTASTDTTATSTDAVADTTTSTTP